MLVTKYPTQAEPTSQHPLISHATVSPAAHSLAILPCQLDTYADAQRPLPPPAVLGALRTALAILDCTEAEDGEGNTGDTVTFQTALGRTVRGAVLAPELTWEMAARVLGRPFR